MDALPAANENIGPAFSKDALRLDEAAEAERIAAELRRNLRELRRRGVVVGLSGGVDSSVTAALCVAALGPDRVLGIFMPERDSDPDSLRLGRLVADSLGIQTVLEDIGPMLAASGCYARRDAAIRSVFSDYDESGWTCKVIIDPDMRDRGYNISSLVVRSAGGEEKRAILPLEAYLGIIAATNMKQRTRKQIEYYHADRLNYAVAGTPNRLEYDQGFFVKNGDGAADIKPIAHLYKSQVYQLARYLGVPEAVTDRPPTTDTWSMPQSQEEYYFSVDHETMDLCLFGLENGVAAAELAKASGLTPSQIQTVWKDIAAKRRVADYLHAPPRVFGDLSRAGS